MSRSALLHFDGTDGSSTFVDVEGSTVTAHGSPTLSAAHPKFGATSAKLSSANHISLPASVGELPSDAPWAIDMWVYRPDGVGGCLVSRRNSAVYCPYVMTVDAGGRICILYSSSNVAWNSIAATSLTVPADTLTHVKFCGYYDTTLNVWAIKTFIGGVADATLVPLSGFTACSYPLYIGSDPDIGGEIYVDEFRVLVGENDGSVNFTPQTAPYDTITGIVPGFCSSAFGSPILAAPMSVSVAGFISSAFGSVRSKYPQNATVGGYQSTYFGSFGCSQFFTPRLLVVRCSGWRKSTFGQLVKVGPKSASIRGWIVHSRFPKPRSRRINKGAVAGFNTTMFSTIHG